MAVQDAADVGELDQLRQRSVGCGLGLAESLAQLGRQPREADRRVECGLVGELDRGTIGATEMVRVEREPAQRSARDDLLHMSLGTGRAEPGHDELIGGHALQHEADAVVVADRDLARAAADGVAHARRTHDRRGHRFGLARAGRDDLHFAHRLAVPTDVACDLRAHHARLPAHDGEQAFGLGASMRIEHLRTALLEPRDPAQHLLCGARAEARELGEPAIARGVVEFLERVDAESFVDPTDARGAEPRDAQHLEESLGRRLAEPVEQGRVAGRLDLLEHIDHFGREASSIAPQEIRHRLRVGRCQRPRRVGVGRRHGRILSLQLEQGHDLVEEVGDGA